MRFIFYCCFIVIISQKVFAFGDAQFVTDDFIISLPSDSHFIQKEEQGEALDSIIHAYLFEPDVASTQEDTPMQKSIFSKTPYLNVFVFRLDPRLEPKDSAIIQRQYINTVHESIKKALRIKYKEKQLANAKLFKGTFVAGNKKIHSLHYDLDDMEIAYYTFIVRRNLYFFQALYLPGKKSLLNDAILKSALSTLVVES